MKQTDGTDADQDQAGDKASPVGFGRLGRAVTMLERASLSASRRGIIVGLGIVTGRHDNPKDDIEPKTSTEAQDRYGKKQPHQGRVDAEIVGQTGANATDDFVSCVSLKFLFH